MIKTLFFLAALALAHAVVPDFEALDDSDSCEYLDNGCPADFDVHKLLPHEYSCWRYYSCSNGDKILQRCPRGTIFDPEKEVCVYGAPDRDCINDDRTVTVEEDSPEIDDIELLPNGCPANYTIGWLLPHELYCNMYYQCNFGGKLPMICPPLTHFNPAIQACDHIGVVGCTLPGGDFSTTTTTPAPPTPTPEFETWPNGCPRNGSINWLVPHATNCSLFYACSWGALIQMECPGNTHFSPALQRCESPATAGCAANPCNKPGNSCPDDPPLPNDPAPEDPEDPAPEDPAPEDPAPEDPAPEDPAPEDPAPEDPAPEDPAPEDPAPEDPAPEDPAPEDPAPEDPAPEDPCPGEPNPDQRCEEDCNSLPWAHDDCDKYWICNGNKAELIVCSEGLQFNPSTNTCDFACNAGCVRENVQATSTQDGLKLYFPWNKIDDKTKELLKLIAY